MKCQECKKYLKIGERFCLPSYLNPDEGNPLIFCEEHFREKMKDSWDYINIAANIWKEFREAKQNDQRNMGEHSNRNDSFSNCY